MNTNNDTGYHNGKTDADYRGYKYHTENVKRKVTLEYPGGKINSTCNAETQLAVLRSYRKINEELYNRTGCIYITFESKMDKTPAERILEKVENEIQFKIKGEE